MKRQKLFASFLKRWGSRLIDLTQPSPQVIQSLFRFRIVLESQRITEAAMTFFAIPLAELTFPSLADGLLR
jgi:hypothetical protein